MSFRYWEVSSLFCLKEYVIVYPAILGQYDSYIKIWQKQCPALAARISGRFAPSNEAKSASLSGAPTSCDSERAASAFLKKLGGRSIVRKSPIGEG